MHWSYEYLIHIGESMEDIILYVNILILLLLILFWKYGRNTSPGPPGPRSFPFLGCLPHLISSGKPLPVIVKNHRKIYGDISAFPLVRMNFGDIETLNDLKLENIKLIFSLPKHDKINQASDGDGGVCREALHDGPT